MNQEERCAYYLHFMGQNVEQDEEQDEDDAEDLIMLNVCEDRDDTEIPIDVDLSEIL